MNRPAALLTTLGIIVAGLVGLAQTPRGSAVARIVGLIVGACMLLELALLGSYLPLRHWAGRLHTKVTHRIEGKFRTSLTLGRSSKGHAGVILYLDEPLQREWVHGSSVRIRDARFREMPAECEVELPRESTVRGQTSHGLRGWVMGFPSDFGSGSLDEGKQYLVRWRVAGEVVAVQKFEWESDGPREIGNYRLRVLRWVQRNLQLAKGDHGRSKGSETPGSR